MPPPSQRYGKVFVGPIEAARGLSFDAVFVPGLAEKMFPRKIVEEPILLDVAARADRRRPCDEPEPARTRASCAGTCGRRGRAPDLFLLSPSRSRPGSAARAVLLRSGSRAGRRGPASRFRRACAPSRDGNDSPARLAGAARSHRCHRRRRARSRHPRSPHGASGGERRGGPLSAHRQSVSRPSAAEPAISAGADPGHPPMGCSVGRRRSGRSWRGTRSALEAIRRPRFRTTPAAPTGSFSRPSTASLRARCRRRSTSSIHCSAGR